MLVTKNERAENIAAGGTHCILLFLYVIFGRCNIHRKHMSTEISNSIFGLKLIKFTGVSVRVTLS